MSDAHGPQQGASAPTSAPAAPPPPTTPDTDGVSLAAFVTGLLSLGPVPLVLGIVGYERTRRRDGHASWMAISGIVLGAVSTVGLMVVALVVTFSLLLVGHAVQVHDRYGDGTSWSWSRDAQRAERVGGDDARS